MNTSRCHIVPRFMLKQYRGDLDFFYISDRTSLLSLLCGGGDVGDKFNKKSEVKIEKSQRVFQIRNLLFPVVCI